MAMVELYRAWNWLAFGNLSGEFDERTSMAFVLDDGTTHILPSFSEQDAFEAEGRLNLARDLIASAVESGKLALYGRRVTAQASTAQGISGFDAEKIDPAFVADAGFEGGSDDLTLIGNSAEFQDLYVPFAELRALFPFWDGQTEVGGTSSGNHAPVLLVGSDLAASPVLRPTAAAERECEGLITSLANESPDDVKSKKEMWTRSKEKIGDRLSYKAFIRAWNRCAPAAWKRPGRKPRSNSLLSKR